MSGMRSGLTSSSTTSSYGRAAYASSSSRDAPNPARLNRWAIRARRSSAMPSSQSDQSNLLLSSVHGRRAAVRVRSASTGRPSAAITAPYQIALALGTHLEGDSGAACAECQTFARIHSEGGQSEIDVGWPLLLQSG